MGFSLCRGKLRVVERTKSESFRGVFFLFLFVSFVSIAWVYIEFVGVAFRGRLEKVEGVG